MASFFSLQPSQTTESNLSKFASATPGLEHVGSSQSFLDPSLGGGETLHSPFEDEATQALQGMQGSSLMQPSGDDGAGSVSGVGGQYQSNVTGTQFKLPDPRALQQQPQSSLSEGQQTALQGLGQTQQVVGAIPNSLVNTFKQSIKGTEYESMSDSEINDFINSLGSGDYTQTLERLTGNEYANYYEPLNEGAYSPSGYDLGDTTLDSSFLGQYDAITGARTPPSALDKFGKSDIMGVLGLAQAGVTGDPAQIAKALNNVAPNVVKYVTDNQDVIGSAGSVAQVLGGAYSLYQGMQSQNPTQIAQGMVSVVQGTAGSKYGIEVLSQLTGASTQAFSQAFGALGGVTGAISLYQSIQSGDPIQALLSAASIYSSLSTLAPSIFTPLTTLAADALIAIAPQIAASLGITGSSAAGGAVVGATAGVSAAMGPLAMIIGPYIVGKAIDMVAEMQHAESMKKVATRYGNLTSSIPGHFAAIQQAPALLEQLQQPGVTPQQAADIFKQLQAIQTNFDQSGMEDFLQRGFTEVAGGGDLGSGASKEFKQAPELLKAMEPYLEALTYGRLLAQDIASRGGVEVEGALSPHVYAMNLGGEDFKEKFRPGSTYIASGVEQDIDPFTGMSRMGSFDLMGDRERPAPPQMLKLAGLPQDRYYTVGDVQNYLGAGGAGKGVADQYQQTDFGMTNMPLWQQISALQPGQYEQGLQEFFTQGGFASPLLSKYNPTWTSPEPWEYAPLAPQYYQPRPQVDPYAAYYNESPGGL